MSLPTDVHAFHVRFGHPAPALPQVPDAPEWVDHRKDLIKEEARELCDAIDLEDLVKIAREAVDVTYVALGTLVAYGLPAQLCWDAVHNANMRKEPAPLGEKPRKPEGWVSPDENLRGVVEGLLEAADGV